MSINKGIKIFFFSNGNAIVFDENDKQAPELSSSWLLMFLQHIQERTGVEPDKIEQILLPGGLEAKPFKTSDGDWNWRVE